MAIARSMCLFFQAGGLCEIGGGYLIWLWLREGKPGWLGLLGALTLALYGVVATWLTANFGRVYVVYGGVFIVMALFWGWSIDGILPDRYDFIRAMIALFGVLVMMYWPRTPSLRHFY